MKRLLSLALALLAVPIAVLAQPALETTPEVKPEVAPAVAAPKGTGEVVINSPQGTSTFNDKTGVGVITKDVTITQSGEDFILYAQRVVFSRPKNQATATQDLRVETRDSTIRAERMFGDFNSKVLSMVGSVVVSSYGENDGVQTPGAAQRRAAQNRKPVRISCDRLDWNYDTRQATLVGNLRLVQGENVGTCTKIIYDEPKNAARLIGDVKFGNSKNQRFLGDELIVFMDQDLVQSNTGIKAFGPVKNEAEAGQTPAPKATETFPEPATIGDEADLPAPPPDIDNFLKNGGTKAKATPPPTPKPTEKAAG